MSDWIKIHRGVLDSFCFANSDHFKIWIWMLLKANYKKSFIPLNYGRGTTTIEVDRGQFIFGRNRAQEELKINGSAIYRIMQKFEDLKQISIESNSHYSLITICNYNSYQNIKDKDEQPVNSQRTTGEQLANSQRTTGEHIKEELEEIEGREEKEQKANPINEDTIVGRMASVWMKVNPKYQMEELNDFPPLLKIAYKIAKAKGWQQSDVTNGKLDETVNSWDKVVSFIRGDDFYKKLELTTIEKKWTGLIQTMQAVKEGSSKKDDSPKQPKIIRD